MPLDKIAKNKTISKYKYILFDLDGTLTDPGLGITNSVIYSLKKLGIEETDKEKLYKFIGPPLFESYMKYYGFDKDTADKAVELYREYFKVTGLYENEVYEGIHDMLDSIRECGIKTLVATSKPEIFAIEILKHFNLYDKFDFVAGATLDGKRMKKADVIKYACDSFGIVDYSHCLMVGDREHDVIGAKEVGITCCGVTYGYGSYDELKNSGARYIVNTPKEILEIKIRGRK